jgi:CRP-like cAMP-binding protein
MSIHAISSGMQTLLRKILENVSAFRDLKLEEVAEVFQFAEKKIFQPQDPIVIEGKVGSYMYILIDGEAIVSKRITPGVSTELRRLGPADCFGEMSIVDNEPRSASVTAATTCTLLRLNAQALQIRPEIGMRIFRNIARSVIEKLRALEQETKAKGKTGVPAAAPADAGKVEAPAEPEK